MTNKHCGRQSMVFPTQPSVLSYASVVGKKEGDGPLSSYFDEIHDDTKFGQNSWEQAESQMQVLALDNALKKCGKKPADLDLIFAGDLLNQCICSGFSQRSSGIPFYGLYGACSTMAEGLSLAAMAVDGGYARCAAALTSSHYASAERQYRLPLVYGGQRTPTAQWTVTGSGCVLLACDGNGPYLNAATTGVITDKGIKDANNMGAAMAPAAFDTIRAHLQDLHKTPEDYDLIVTGDLGALGKEIVIDLFRKDGMPIQNVYDDCGTMIYSLDTQDVHTGGSGCGCSAAVLCGYLFSKIADASYRNILFCGTGALLSPTSTQQGESIPCICHAVSISSERR